MARDLGTRVLATVLFTDVVDSTRIAEEVGDLRWKELLRRHHSIVRRELKRFRGREIDTAGDGFLALFDSPAQAVRCACAVSEAVRELGIEIRAGLHLGEVELSDGMAQGIGVHIGARILSYAGPGDVVVSSPLRTTVAGSDVEFEARGRRRLKGVAGTWPLFAVASVDGQPTSPALEPEEAARRRAAISPVAAGRRPTTILVVTLVALAAAAAAGLLMARGDAPPPRGDIGPQVGSLVLLDPRTNRAEEFRDVFYTSVGQGVQVVPRVAAGEGSVWIQAGPRISAFDSDRREVSRTIRSPELAFGDQGFEVGYRTVWVFIGNVVRGINPATGEFLLSTTHPEWSAFGGDLAIGSGGVWVGDRGSIFRLDPQTGQVSRRIDFPGTVDQLTTGEGSLWVADELARVILRIDPRKSRVLEEIPLSGGLDEITVGEGSLWILDSTAGTLTSIEPDTGAVRPPIPVGSDPTGLDAGLGAVWVSGGVEGIVTRINPNTGAAMRIHVGGPVSAITVDEDERVVWVTIS